ncbi:MAG TPA: 50S ribosomal protein L10 [Pirellulaceae bacterium]
MSKYIKDLMTKELSGRLEGVKDAVVVNVVGLNSLATFELRKQLREKNIRLLVVKSSLAQRATEGTPLAGAFGGCEGPLAIMWGAEDMVALAKEAMRLHRSKDVEAFQARGGVMDGESLSATRLEEVSKWPTREEQLSILMGQILSPGRNLVGALLGPGGALASQIKQLSEEKESAPAEA